MIKLERKEVINNNVQKKPHFLVIFCHYVIKLDSVHLFFNSLFLLDIFCKKIKYTFFIKSHCKTFIFVYLRRNTTNFFAKKILKMLNLSETCQDNIFVTKHKQIGRKKNT